LQRQLLPSYSSYNEICLRQVNIATAWSKLRRRVRKWRTVATDAVKLKLKLELEMKTERRRCCCPWGFRQETQRTKNSLSHIMRNVLAARLLLITVINLVRQQIEIKRRRRSRSTARSSQGNSRRMQSEENRDFVWVTMEVGWQKKSVTTLLLSCS